MTVGNAEHALHRAHGASNTGADCTTNHAAYGTGNPVAFIRAFLRTAHDALSVAGVRQGQQRKQAGCGEQQADGQAGRERCGGDTGFVHVRPQGK
jgi:hypothetical protein